MKQTQQEQAALLKQIQGALAHVYEAGMKPKCVKLEPAEAALLGSPHTVFGVPVSITGRAGDEGA